MEKKKISLFSIIATLICVVFVAEAAAPVAALGNTQYFWWVFMIIFFLLPYGLISSELGTAYAGDGGLYDWVHAAYPGTKWGGRVSWYYWLNFPLWMASLAVMIPDLISIAFGIELNTIVSLIIQLAYVWIVTFICTYPIADSVVILNICAVIKVALAILVGCMGIYFIVKNGFTNDMSGASFIPSFDLDSLSFISVIIFNMLGFEVICTFKDNMKDPKKDIPQAIVIGGIVIAAVYLFSGFGIGSAIATSDIAADSGLIDAFIAITGKEGGVFIAAVALLFMVTLFGNMISWSTGVHECAAYAADNGDMPAVFGKRSAKNDMPTGGIYMTAIVATIVVVLGVIIGVIAPESSLFWSFFALNLVLFLASYLPIFPGFLKLRKTDPDRERPYKVPGSNTFLKFLAWIPFVLIVVSIFFTAIPLSADAVADQLPIAIGAVISVILGEIVIATLRKKNK